MFRKSVEVIEGGVEGWDYYKRLTTPETKKRWLIKTYADWYVSYGKKDKTNDINPNTIIAIDLRLFILSKAKQESIDAFIKYFGNNHPRSVEIKGVCSPSYNVAE